MMNTAEVAGCGLKSLALTRNVRVPRSSKKCKEKDNSIFQFLPVILRGIKGLQGSVVHSEEFEEILLPINQFPAHKQAVNSLQRTPSTWKQDSLTYTVTSPQAARLQEL